VIPVSALVVNVSIISVDGDPIQTAWSLPRDLPAGSFAAVFLQSSVSLEAGSYLAYVGFQDSKHALQQFEALRFDIMSEEPKGHFPRTFGAGVVLNSMEVGIDPVQT
jgi:hypothetical protein